MAFFGEDKSAQIDDLKNALRASEQRRKDLSKQLACEREKSAALLAEIEAGKSECEKLKAALVKVRQRQKASVERANRFKTKLSSEAGAL